MKRVNRYQGLLLIFAIAAAGALKIHYHSATGAGLSWILAPTAHLVNAWTGEHFSPDRAAEYRNSDGSVAIAPACAGVNFFIICFSMLVFLLARRAHNRRTACTIFLGSIAAAYAATLAVNTVRILLSIRALETASPYAWFGYEDLHRMEGIAVYFLSLSLIYTVAEAFANRGTLPAATFRPRRRLPLAVPLFWYFLITLGIPILRMAYRDDPRRFIEHSVYVLIIPLAAVLGLVAVRRAVAVGTLRVPRRRLALAAGLVLFPALAYGLWDTRPSGDARFDKGRNGLWLGQQWYTGVAAPTGEAITTEELDALLSTLRVHGIRYAYPFAGHLNRDGALNLAPTHFLRDLQAAAPDVVFLPWICGDADELPLADPAWRRRVIGTLGAFFALGIAGVHLDIEPIRDHHPGYVALLSEIRDQFDGQFFVSQATRRVAPFGRAAGPLREHFWSRAFYADTMRVSDQSVLMGYNTLLESPKLYRAYLSHQTELLLGCAAAVPGHQVLIGIPSYDDVPEFSNPEVENVENGVLGVRHALERHPGFCAQLAGVAVFAEWTTSDTEWAAFDATWR